MSYFIYDGKNRYFTLADLGFYEEIINGPNMERK